MKLSQPFISLAILAIPLLSAARPLPYGGAPITTNELSARGTLSPSLVHEDLERVTFYRRGDSLTDTAKNTETPATDKATATAASPSSDSDSAKPASGKTIKKKVMSRDGSPASDSSTTSQYDSDSSGRSSPSSFHSDHHGEDDGSDTDTDTGVHNGVARARAAATKK